MENLFVLVYYQNWFSAPHVKIVNKRNMHLWPLNSFKLSPWPRLPRFVCTYQSDHLNHVLAQTLRERVVACLFFCVYVFVCLFVFLYYVYMAVYVLVTGLLLIFLLAGRTHLEGIS